MPSYLNAHRNRLCRRPQDPTLDFFGFAVKAQDLLNVAAQFELLGVHIGRCKEPSLYRLEPLAQLSAPKWAKTLGWSSKDDSMLLVGVHTHGLNNWERIIRDPALGLQEKLAGTDICVI